MLRAIVTLLAASAALAQGTLQSTFNGSHATPPGGAVYFDVAATVANPMTITAIGANLEALAGQAATIDVYTVAGSAQAAVWNAAAWTQVATVPVTTAGVGQPTIAALAAPLTIPAGATVGMALVANGVGHRYSLIGSPGANVYSQCGFSITGVGSSITPFVFSPGGGTANVSLQFASTTCAIAETLGTGCEQRFASFYQAWTPAAYPLANKTLTAQSVGGTPGSGYQVVVAPSTGAIAAGAGAVAVPLANDSQAPMGTLGLVVSDNGWVAAGGGNSNSYIPWAPDLLLNPATAVYAWTDLDPTWPGSGPVMYEESGTTAIVTYDGVACFGSGVTNIGGTAIAHDTATFQIRWDTATGDFEIRFGPASANLVENWLVGFSPGGGSDDPGPAHLLATSAASPHAVAAADVAPLTLEPMARPIQGAAPTTFDVRTSGISSSAILHVGLVSLTSPAMPLSFLGFGSGDCVLYAMADVMVGPAVVAGGVANVSWTAHYLPTIPFYGYEFFCQAVTLDLNVISSGGRVSNGLRCVVGNF